MKCKPILTEYYRIRGGGFLLQEGRSEAQNMFLPFLSGGKCLREPHCEALASLGATGRAIFFWGILGHQGGCNFFSPPSWQKHLLSCFYARIEEKDYDLVPTLLSWGIQVYRNATGVLLSFLWRPRGEDSVIVCPGALCVMVTLIGKVYNEAYPEVSPQVTDAPKGDSTLHRRDYVA